MPRTRLMLLTPTSPILCSPTSRFLARADWNSSRISRRYVLDFQYLLFRCTTNRFMPSVFYVLALAVTLLNTRVEKTDAGYSPCFERTDLCQRKNVRPHSGDVFGRTGCIGAFIDCAAQRSRVRSI